MTKMNLTRSLLAAGILAAAGVAQAAQTFDVPQKAGEASTMTNGRPNLETNTVANDRVDTLGADRVLVNPTMVMGAGPAPVVALTPVTPPNPHVHSFTFGQPDALVTPSGAVTPVAPGSTPIVVITERIHTTPILVP